MTNPPDPWTRARASRRGLLALAAAPLLAAGALAQPAPWPGARPIRLVVPFPPGGPTDTVSRVVGQQLGARLGQTVLPDNRPGASGAIAAAEVARSPPDGHTLMMLATPTLLAPHLYRSVDYDVGRDFAPVALVYDLPIVIVVNPSQLPGVADLQALMAHARAQKTPLNYTSSGPGSFGHLSMELLKQMGGFDMQHVPYKGGVPAITDTLGGQVPVMYADLVAALPHIQAGKLRAIAVGSPRRVRMLPGVKTITEQGIQGYDAVSWGALLAPRNTPPPVVDRIARELDAILAGRDIQDRLLNAGAIAHFEGPAQLAQRIRSDDDRWGRLIRDKGIAPA